MHTSDWITLVGAGIATLAFVVSARALRLQHAGAKADIRQDFEDLIRQLWLALGKSFGDQRPDSGVPPSDVEAALGEIQTLALRAHFFLLPTSANKMATIGWHQRLLQLWSSPSEKPQANWYDAVVLANSFAQVWDYEKAKGYWELAVDLSTGPDAEVGPMAQITTLREVGIFYYGNATDSGVQLGRDAFKRAFHILEPKANGEDFTYFQNSVTRFLQALQEDQLDNTEQAAQYIRDAWNLSTNVRANWRRQQVQRDISGFLADRLSYESSPFRLQHYDGLPQELKDAVASLKAQQPTPDVQNQIFADAWQQGFTAAQYQMSAVKPPSVLRQPPDSCAPTNDG